MGVIAAEDPALLAWAADIGADGPVAVRGGGTAWDVGGPPDDDVRVVAAPAGVRAFEPADLTVRVGAGTPVHDLLGELAGAGQTVALPAPADVGLVGPADVGAGATVGGVLAVGRSGLARLGHGPVRDTVLGCRAVTASGALVTAGGATVKNVSGFDLCRLLVGSLGTLALFGEVTLRTQPLPEATRWLAGPADPWAVRRALYRPTTVLWDGDTTWVRLDGHRGDLDDQAAAVAPLGLVPLDDPGTVPRPVDFAHRWSVVPADLRATVTALDGRWVAEVGVGTVHTHMPPPTRTLDPAVADLHRRLRDRFDPAGRLNPGRRPELA